MLLQQHAERFGFGQQGGSDNKKTRSQKLGYKERCLHVFPDFVASAP